MGPAHKEHNTAGATTDSLEFDEGVQLLLVLHTIAILPLLDVVQPQLLQLTTLVIPSHTLATSLTVGLRSVPNPKAGNCALFAAGAWDVRTRPCCAPV